MQDLTSWETAPALDQFWQIRFAQQLKASSKQVKLVQHLIDDLEDGPRLKKHLSTEEKSDAEVESNVSSGSREAEKGDDSTDEEVLAKASCLASGPATADEEGIAKKLKIVFLKRAATVYFQLADLLVEQEAVVRGQLLAEQVEKGDDYLPQFQGSRSAFYSESIFLLHTMELSFDRMLITPPRRFLELQEQATCCLLESQSLAAAVLGSAVLVGVHAAGGPPGVTIGTATILGVGVLFGLTAEASKAEGVCKSAKQSRWKEIGDKMAELKNSLTISEIIELHQMIDKFFLKPLQKIA